MKNIRIGIDVGGTFTDFVVVDHSDPHTPKISSHKVPSTPADPSQAVEDGLVDLIEAGLNVSQIEALLHGTTIGLNAIIQRSGAKVALVVSQGHRDVLEIARSRMPRSFDLHATRQNPLVRREHVVEVSSRLSPLGEVVEKPSLAEIDDVVSQLEAIEPEAIAVSTIGGYANPAAEAELADEIAKRMPGVPVSSAAAMWPEIREYERSIVAVLNSHIQPLMHNYFDKLRDRLSGLGVEAPLYITASNGGSLTLEAARERSLDTALSGPASGVTAAAKITADAHLITFDMGGTSSDISVISDSETRLTTKASIGEFPLILPVVEVSAIGAGGGSVLWADLTGERPSLKIGPHSAGAFPGPACYGNGGESASITDCYLLAGFVDGTNFLGGRMPLNRDASIEAINSLRSKLGWSESISPPELAWSALSIATAQMSTELRKVLAQQGSTPDGRTLVPFGGAGPTHSVMLAEQLGISKILIPSTAATFCALGAALSPLRKDFSLTVNATLVESYSDELNFTALDLVGQAREWITMHAGSSDGATTTIWADMKYEGQAYDLVVDLGKHRTSAVNPEDNPVVISSYSARTSFEQEHTRLYGFTAPDAAIEITNLRVSVSGPDVALSQPAASSLSYGTPVDPHGTHHESRDFYWEGEWFNARVIAETDLSSVLSGDLSGPLVIDKKDTTIVVPANWSARADSSANVTLTKRGS